MEKIQQLTEVLGVTESQAVLLLKVGVKMLVSFIYLHVIETQ